MEEPTEPTYPIYYTAHTHILSLTPGGRTTLRAVPSLAVPGVSLAQLGGGASCARHPDHGRGRLRNNYEVPWEKQCKALCFHLNGFTHEPECKARQAVVLERRRREEREGARQNWPLTRAPAWAFVTQSGRFCRARSASLIPPALKHHGLVCCCLSLAVLQALRFGRRLNLHEDCGDTVIRIICMIIMMTK